MIRDTIEEQFRRFHTDNPWVFARLLEMTEELYRQGRTRMGIKMLWETLRWNVETGRIVEASGRPCLPNAYTSRYARLIAESHPMYARVFELRPLRRD